MLLQRGERVYKVSVLLLGYFGSSILDSLDLGQIG